ncbi:MAG: hypothetical protein H7325_09710 [Pedobacter sp.]|nr:hypothetical protein [Pedobacter sp.]
MFLNARFVITELSSICESRFHAYNYYPNARGAQEKFQEITRLRYQLKEISKMEVNRFQIIELLRLEMGFHTLAGSPTRKMHQTYMKKVNGIFDACRAYLGRVKQW